MKSEYSYHTPFQTSFKFGNIVPSALAPVLAEVHGFSTAWQTPVILHSGQCHHNRLPPQRRRSAVSVQARSAPRAGPPNSLVFPRLREELLPAAHSSGGFRFALWRHRRARRVERCAARSPPNVGRFPSMLGGRYRTVPDGQELSITADDERLDVLDADRRRSLDYPTLGMAPSPEPEAPNDVKSNDQENKHNTSTPSAGMNRFGIRAHCRLYPNSNGTWISDS